MSPFDGPSPPLMLQLVTTSSQFDPISFTYNMFPLLYDLILTSGLLLKLLQ